jgi:hypothetical protein
LGELERYQLLIPDGRHGYTRKFRLNIPGITPIVIDQNQTDVSLEEWESRFLTDEELQEQGLLEDQAQLPPPPDELEENQGLQLPPPPDELEDDEPTQPMPAVVAVRRPPETPPPIIGRLSTVVAQAKPPAPPPIIVDSQPPVPPEKFQKDIEVMRVAANLVLGGKMKLDIYMHRGRSKGFSDQLLNAMLGRGGETGSPYGHHNLDGPVVANEIPKVSTTSYY